MTPKTALIIGAGPAGLTAAYELLTRTDIQPIVLEMSSHMGGISKTFNYKGNRIDIGGHRFFSKSDRVMDWWLRMLPMESRADAGPTMITYHRQSRALEGGSGVDAAETDRVMLLRERKSRIYFLRRFFDYPISLSPDTLGKLGLGRTFKIGCSYLKSMAFPIRPEANLEHFFVNRFGRELYQTFFKSYTEKVWGVPCHEISAEWGAQRIKGLSITKAIAHFLKKALGGPSADLAQKDTETSLIEQFLYPKFGPGQMWEEVARQVVALGGQVITETEAVAVHQDGQRLTGVTARHRQTGETTRYDADYVFSTMPVRELTRALDTPLPEPLREIAEGLQYRDFLTVGLLLDRLKVKEAGEKLIKDNWIYIQEADVLVGRLQIFNNWSPYMVADPTKVWVGMEYFLNESDPLWSQPDSALQALGVDELHRIDIIDRADVLDGVVLRQPKAYPAYYGTYARFGELRAYLDGLENLFLVGRNGMHRYNNQDHSMLTAMTAVDNLLSGRTDKANMWEINTEEDYHEVKKPDEGASAAAA